MKKVLFALLLVASAFVFFGMQASAAGTGNLVVHFQAWDEADYDNLGSHAWGSTATGRLASGTDDFGVYFEFNDLDIDTEIGFIAVTWIGTDGPDWNKKLTGDVMIAADVVQEDKTTHVFVFQGAEGAQYLVADPDNHSVIVLYYDSAGAYEENLGIHHWGWTAAGPEWASPAQVFNTVGKSPSDTEIMGFALASEDITGAGFLIYAGSDGTKKTGDIKNETGFFQTHTDGTYDILYVVNAGDGFTSNENVYTDPQLFADDAFSFNLMPFNNEDKSGTFAVDPTTIFVKTSSPVASPYPLAVDKDAARAEIENWFTVREITGEDTYGDPLAIERVDFATTNTTLNQFVIILENAMDNTKEYEIFFDLNYPEEALDVAKEVTVTLNVTVPANTPYGAEISVAGSLQSPDQWTPGVAAYTATQVDDTLVYTLTFTVDVIEAYTTFEYKWTRGSWPTEEFIASNRPLVIPNNVDTIEFNDVVEAWADIDAPAEKYAAPERTAMVNSKASLVLDLDTEAPVITFISPTGIVGKVPAERIIEVTWGQPFNQLLFPRYRADDDRDGDLTPFVFVPKGQSSVLDTRTEGDYTIMLRVVDKWGNVTEETFIFRVVKSN
ncbi:MAG: hypothetical protein NUK62_07720 [Tenericutes bacterium]|nr:hypothetical protein [Mycoplasmatota bacterium]